MQLTLANHPVTDMQFGAPARLDGAVLVVDPARLRALVMQDDSFAGVEFEVVRPGEPCRAGGHAREGAVHLFRPALWHQI